MGTIVIGPSVLCLWAAVNLNKKLYFQQTKKKKLVLTKRH